MTLEGDQTRDCPQIVSSESNQNYPRLGSTAPCGMHTQGVGREERQLLVGNGAAMNSVTDVLTEVEHFLFLFEPLSPPDNLVGSENALTRASVFLKLVHESV